MIALRNPIDNLVRIYGQFQTIIVGNDTGKGQSSQFAGCLMKGQGREELVTNTAEIQQLIELDDDSLQRLENNANYYVDCHDPGNWADSVEIKLKNGQIIGQALTITEMEPRRKGKLWVCSQSLHVDVDWLKDWVDHQFAMGADEVILHAPKGVGLF